MSESLQKIREARGLKRGVVEKFENCQVANDCPLLFGLLHDREYKGKECLAGSVIVVIEDGLWKAIVNDRQEGQVAFYSAPTWQELWNGVEKGLGDGTLDWRGARQAPNGRFRTR